MNKNQKGFSVVEGLLILIIVGLIGFTGWYVWHSKNNADKSLQLASNTSASTQTTSKKTANTTIDPYAGWKSYCDSAIKACIKYPSDWSAGQYGGFENPAATEYASLVGPTVKDGGSGSAYIASIDDLGTPNSDLKIVGAIVNNQPSYSLYNASYISSNNIKVGETKNIDYINHRFTGKTGQAGLDGTPDKNGYASIKTFDQAKAWFNSNEAKEVLKVLQSFYYQ